VTIKLLFIVLKYTSFRIKSINLTYNRKIKNILHFKKANLEISNIISNQLYLQRAFIELTILLTEKYSIFFLDDGDTTSLINAMFISWNSLSGKSLSKLSCVCLPLEKLVNRKHFPVNENTFRSTENTFQSKKNLVLFPGKCFFF